MALILTAAVVILHASPLNGQELSAFGVMRRSSHPELTDPSGYGFSAGFDFFERIVVSVDYRMFGSTSEDEGEICTWYEPRHQCSVETILGDTKFSTFSVTLLPHFNPTDLVRLGLGGGFSLGRLDSRIEGESGRIARVFIPRTGQFGWLALANVRIGPTDRIPVFLMASLVGHWVDFSGCVHEGGLTYPFCDVESFNGFEGGIGYAFRD